MAKGPVAPLNMTPNGDTVNDFARKYQQEIANIYGELDTVANMGKRIVFTSDSVYWIVDEENNKAKFVVATGGQTPIAIYKTENQTQEKVMVGVTIDGNELTIESDEPFDGFIILA